MSSKAKSKESDTKVDNKKRKLSEIENGSKTTTTSTTAGSSKEETKKPALKRPKTMYSNLSYYPITTMPIVSITSILLNLQ